MCHLQTKFILYIAINIKSKTNLNGIFVSLLEDPEILKQFRNVALQGLVEEETNWGNEWFCIPRGCIKGFGFYSDFASN